ncbi:ABC transporter permease [Jonesia quinghaiensis]|uniref:ABC transporter permease n=1 Tax=Jonesia quinghaiensis TaxID=262806 RepID=UPI000404C52F|nr:ABC transporter permease [Jonesia quinghaiensis]
MTLSARTRTALRGAARFLGEAGLVLWAAVTLAFLVLKAVPGDPVDVMLGPLSSATPEARAMIRADLGLDKPLPTQYASHLGRMVTGDLGMSYQQQRPVSDILTEQLGATMALAAAAMVLAVVLACGAALVTRRGWLRGVADATELLAVSAPVFWTALVLASVFSYQLGWFPIVGGTAAQRVILPAIALALPVAGVLAQVLRHGMDQAESQPFAVTAMARGASHRRLTSHHLMRHGFASTLTLSGFLFGSLLGGAVIVETVFARPGIGRVALGAITNRDLPVVMGVVVFSGIGFLIINAVVDVLARAVDPRLRKAADA